MSDIKKRLIACPICNTLVEFSPNNRFRPFCSERCKLMDLGTWASEQYAIPVSMTSDSSPEDVIQ